jgi:hypothetical protein
MQLFIAFVHVVIVIHSTIILKIGINLTLHICHFYQIMALLYHFASASKWLIYVPLLKIYKFCIAVIKLPIFVPFVKDFNLTLIYLRLNQLPFSSPMLFVGLHQINSNSWIRFLIKPAFNVLYDRSSIKSWSNQQTPKIFIAVCSLVSYNKFCVVSAKKKYQNSEKTCI